jgi:hypothetical protein
MRAIARRLQRLEQRFGLVEETAEAKIVQARLEAARLRCGLSPPSPNRLAGLMGLSVCEILNAGRQHAAAAHGRGVSRI